MKNQENQEKDILQERKELVQDVIDREIKYGEQYKKALREFNKKFPTVRVEPNYAQLSSKSEETI